MSPLKSLWQDFRGAGEKCSSDGHCGQNRGVMEKVQIGYGCCWCGSGDLFLFNFELIHSHFPVWLVSVFVSGVSGLLDLWMAGGKN